MLFPVATTGHFPGADNHSGKGSTGIQSCHEPAGWGCSQARDTGLLVPPIKISGVMQTLLLILEELHSDLVNSS